MKNTSQELKQLSNCIKILSADAVEKSNSGHPGMPLGFSDVMTCLAFKHLKFNPNDANWFNRDRLILSAGHGSMLLYSFFYLADYKGFSLDDIKSFRQLNSKAAGHPEHELFNAIETTTGPLGQGLANAVGMAIAAKKYAAELGKDVCNHKIYAIVGDGCLMEGVAYEALSLAGHLKLDNLVILFDDNNISIDGATSLSVSEDHQQKMQALGFETHEANGHNMDEICNALDAVQDSSKPSFVAFKTTIGDGANAKAGTSKAHGAPLGEQEIDYLKNNTQLRGASFELPEDLLNVWNSAWKRNEDNYQDWQNKYESLPDDKKGYLEQNVIAFDSILLNKQENNEATRVSSGKIIEELLKNNQKLIIGSADLAGSNGMNNNECKRITSDDFTGNSIHYGIREHAMGAIMNGLYLSGFTPIGGTFFVFSDYMRPAIRLAALMELPTIYVMTHDSIGVGEDGPTHQPIEHLASFRAMPNINVFRPVDYIETAECYDLALKSKKTPSMMVLSRQSLPQIRTKVDGSSKKGGYVISEASNINSIDKVIFASGSEVAIAIEVQSKLESGGMSVRVCSVPCFDLLLTQNVEYINSLRANGAQLIAIEAASRLGWSEIIGHDGLFFGMDSFGASAPGSKLYHHFGLVAEVIYKKLV